jgi:hypothetical protein
MESGEKIDFLIDTYATKKKKKDGTVKKPKMSIKELLALIAADPTTRMNDVDIETANPQELSKIKAGKYATWLIKSYINLAQTTEAQFGDPGYERELKANKETFMEDLYKVKEDLQKYDKFKGRLPEELRQIQHLTPRSLYDAVKDFDLTLATTTKAERKSAPVHPGGELMFDGQDWRVIKIEDKGAVGKEAACFYGGNNQETRWCTSAPGASWFDRYIKDGPLYVVFNPNDTDVAPMTGLPKKRYQFHFPSNQFMDPADRQIDLVDFLNTNEEGLKEYFKFEFMKGLSTAGGTKVSVQYPSDSASKFIALYGFDEFFTTLPKNITRLEFIAKSSKLDLNIPDTIGNFTDLTAIHFVGCVATIPPSVCNLTKLQFLSLPDNPNLQRLPDCIKDLPKLSIINLKNSNSNALPEDLRDLPEESDLHIFV